MKRAMLLLVVISGVLLFVTPPAQAIPITVEFTAAGFGNIYGGWPPPPTPDFVTGTIVYDAASTTANINSITSINMTIDGHIYGVGEVGFQSPYQGPYQLIYGLVNGVDMRANRNDFYLLWDQASLRPYGFLFNTPTSPIYSSTNFTNFTVTPIPSTMLLLGSGLAGLIGYGRKRMKK